MRRALYFVIAIPLIIWGWNQYQVRTAAALAEAEGAPLLVEATPGPERAAESRFRCDGRQYCSQMTSCEEATWHLQHCPGMKMDGDHDGIPCEDQFCRH